MEIRSNSFEPHRPSPGQQVDFTRPNRDTIRRNLPEPPSDKDVTAGIERQKAALADRDKGVREGQGDPKPHVHLDKARRAGAPAGSDGAAGTGEAGDPPAGHEVPAADAGVDERAGGVPGDEARNAREALLAERIHNAREKQQALFKERVHNAREKQQAQFQDRVHNAREKQQEQFQERIHNAREKYTEQFQERVHNARAKAHDLLTERIRNARGKWIEQHEGDGGGSDKVSLSETSLRLRSQALGEASATTAAEAPSDVPTARVAELRRQYQEGSLNTTELIVKSAHRMLGGE